MNGFGPSHFGFKQITTDNWNAPDLPLLFPDISPEAWVKATLKPELSPSVPDDVRGLFEMARALFTYSWYFYPMATTGAEQLHWVLEAGAREKCLRLGLPLQIATPKAKPRPYTFAENIQRLVKADAISTKEAVRWDATRQLRNRSSHPTQHQILPPGMTLGGLQSAADLLNRLFR